MQTETLPDFDRLLTFLKQTRGFDFTAYKKNTVMRRVEKRLQVKGISTCSEYIEFLELHPDEFPYLFNTILINVTGFFRDRDAWEYIEKQVLPSIIESKGPDDQIRVWSAGCASGEEPFSLAMLLCEQMGMQAFRDKVKIYGTDADEDALSQARFASYRDTDIAEIPEHLARKYFEELDGRMILNNDLRRSVIFGRHDLIQDAPISRVDLLLCRNTLMYFNSENQDRVVARFAYALTETGRLFLGKAETLLSHNALFTPEELKFRVFTKLPVKSRNKMGVFITKALPDGKTSLPDPHLKLREAVLETCPVAQIITDLKGRLYLANARARAMFAISSSDIGRPIQDLEISYRPIELRSGIEQACNQRRTIEIKEVSWNNALGERIFLDLKINPLYDELNKLLGVSSTWEDISHFKRLQDELVNYNQELETAYEELQSTNEELQTTNEELQSTVEELETTNEELQSTNEELETMNEELQSTNEELETINEEIRLRGDELVSVNAFLEAILNGFSEGVIVVDTALIIVAWNPRSEDLWGIRKEETVGKHLLNVELGFPVEKLTPLLKETLAKNVETSLENVSAINRRGRTIELKMRVMPLPSGLNELRGAIIVAGAVGAEAPPTHPKSSS